MLGHQHRCRRVFALSRLAKAPLSMCRTDSIAWFENLLPINAGSVIRAGVHLGSTPQRSRLFRADATAIQSNFERSAAGSVVFRRRWFCVPGWYSAIRKRVHDLASTGASPDFFADSSLALGSRGAAAFSIRRSIRRGCLHHVNSGRIYSPIRSVARRFAFPSCLSVASGIGRTAAKGHRRICQESDIHDPFLHHRLKKLAGISWLQSIQHVSANTRPTWNRAVAISALLLQRHHLRSSEPDYFTFASATDILPSPRANALADVTFAGLHRVRFTGPSAASAL